MDDLGARKTTGDLRKGNRGAGPDDRLGPVGGGEGCAQATLRQGDYKGSDGISSILF